MPSAGEVAVSFALPGYQAQTIAIRSEAPPSAGYGEGGGAARMQPNPVYAELQPAAPQRQQPKKKAPAKKKVAKKAGPPASDVEPMTQPSQTEGANPGNSNPYPSNYPWPPPPPPQ